MQSYAIYLRKSRADIEAEAKGEGETLARHHAQLMELARRRNLNITKIYKEIVSGENIAARPQMQQLLADISENKYDGVIVMEIERLARGDTIDQGVVAQAFKSTDTKIITPTKTYDPANEFDEEYFEFSLFMSRREYKTIRRRMEAGRLASCKEGNYIGTEAPYGYRKTNPAHKVYSLEIVPEEAEVVKMIYNMYLDGKGPRAIVTELNRMGIPPRKSAVWERPSIKKILENPLYMGKIRWQSKSSGDTLYDGRHEAIISEEIFNAVQDRKENSPLAKVSDYKTVKNYFHGILYCENCGKAMIRRVVTGKDYEHMHCRSYQCRGKVVSASLPEIEEVLISGIKYRLSQIEEQFENNGSENQQIETDPRKPITAELTRLKNQRDKLYDLLERGIYDEAVFLERSAIINEKISSAEAELKKLETEEQRPKLSAEESGSRLRALLSEFEISGPDRRNELLRASIKKIYYHKTTRMCCNKRESDLSLRIDFL